MHVKLVLIFRALVWSNLKLSGPGYWGHHNCLLRQIPVAGTSTPVQSRSNNQLQYPVYPGAGIIQVPRPWANWPQRRTTYTRAPGYHVHHTEEYFGRPAAGVHL